MSVGVFWRQFRSQYHTTGAVLPSGRFLASAITRPLADADRPLRVMEAGPGTGAFTGRILRALKAGDRLTLVELNDAFVDVLRRRLAEDRRWQTEADVEVVHGSVTELPDGRRYGAIVCGLPFNNFPPDVVGRLFDRFFHHLRPGGTFSYFEYLAVRTLKAAVADGATKRRLEGVGAATGKYLKRHGFRDDRVLLNVPPAVAHHLRK